MVEFIMLCVAHNLSVADYTIVHFSYSLGLITLLNGIIALSFTFVHLIVIYSSY